MTILIASDSHGNIDKLKQFLNEVKIDYLFYLGDGLSDLNKLDIQCKVVKVKGNCDFFSSVNDEEIIEIEGIKIMLTHGNEYGVKNGLNSILEYAKKSDVNVVCFGHTHIQENIELQGITFINPGSVKPNFNNISCADLLIINNGKIMVKELKF